MQTAISGCNTYPAVSMRYMRSSGVPQREDTAKKLVTWYPNDA
jgi:hypothetical protein